MYHKTTIRCHHFILLVALIISFCAAKASAQETEQRSEISPFWLLMQTVPSVSWTCFPAQNHFSFEWRVAPLVYSWGMTKLDPPMHYFFVTPPERFAGSIECNVSTQLYTSRIGTSHWGFSGQLLANLPLVERGEYLGLTLGAARYNIAGLSSNYLVGGVSTLFGFLHYILKYSPADEIWMHSIEFRFF
jgi:hypothetical protein